jgi:hypothetical protein
MFQIITNSTLPDIYIEDKQSISIPCFYLTNSNSLANFTPMFNIKSEDNEVINIEAFSYTVSTTPSQYQMLEINIDSLEPLEDISTLYLNGSKYQNLLEIEELVIYSGTKESQSIEEREST